MTPIIQSSRVRPEDMLRTLNTDSYRQAYSRGMNLSTWLEEQDPSDGYNDGLDAFGRLLQAANIRTASLPALGVYASPFEAFGQSDATRTLATEWMARQWRSVQGNVSTRGLYTSADAVQPAIAGVIAANDDIRVRNPLVPAIPLAELVALTSSISAGIYQTYYLDEDVSETQMRRVAEGTDIPTAKLKTGQQAVRLAKYGRALEMSYEQMRRMPLDLVSLHIQRMAVRAENDKIAAIVDVIINGDGNAGTAAMVYNLTALDPATTAGTLTLKAWLAFKMKFANPYMATTALAQEAAALSLMLLSTGSSNIPLVSIAGASGFGSFRAINPGLNEAVALGWTDGAPTSTIVALDSRMAIERVTETGATITEADQFIRKQTNMITFSETEGYAVFDRNAAKVLNIAA